MAAALHGLSVALFDKGTCQHSRQGLKPVSMAHAPGVHDMAALVRAQVCMGADEALQAVLQGAPAPVALATLTALLPHGDDLLPKEAPEGPFLQAVIKSMSRVVGQLSAAEALDAVTRSRRLLPGLFDAFKHSSADVRKAVVFCLVDLWLVRLLSSFCLSRQNLQHLLLL